MDIGSTVREAICRTAGLDDDDIEDDSSLGDLGINAIMARELVQELEAALGDVKLDSDQILQCDDIAGLVQYVQERAPSGTTNGSASRVQTGSDKPGLSKAQVQDVFQVAKAATDRFIEENHMTGYVQKVMPRTTELCIAYFVEAFEQLGCHIKSAQPGERLAPVQHLPKYEKFMRHWYQLLSKTAGLIEMNGSGMTRTATPCPSKPASKLLEHLLQDEPAQTDELKLTQLTGESLADCLSGKKDGIQVIFGTPQGRKLVSDLYATAPINRAWIEQLGFFLEQLTKTLPKDGQPLRILEIGAGTGGTTTTVVPILARLGVPVTYTMTDISPSLVAAARKQFKEYAFMDFKVVDLEKSPEQGLLNSQDVILSTACVHATRSLPTSLRNARAMLDDGGILVLLEQTEKIPWVDSVFGLLEGWWLFEDGREHALSPATYWEKIMKEVGFGHVDWTKGEHQEAALQKLIIAYK
ncbi:methyltransferase domain-containing protein [Sarocladium implicatum]|nr:methyltransferase domain-containing protein [Sarocladium implicatum]